MGMFYNIIFFLNMIFDTVEKKCQNEKIFVKQGIKHIWLCHRQQCYLSLVLPQNKLPFRVRIILTRPERNLKKRSLEL